MTFFIKLENGQPIGSAITESNLKQILVDVEFPLIVTFDFIEPLGYGIYDFSMPPTPNKYQKPVEITPIKNEFGVWQQTWQLVEMTAEEKVAADTFRAEQLRLHRNVLLSKCDWTRLDDAPITAEQKNNWAAYRQALRDVPTQGGFPWEVTWPTEP